jgi:hypothetical protein
MLSRGLRRLCFLGLPCLGALAACSTLATQGAIGQNLPSSGVGPFQALAQTQVAPADVAPFVCLEPGKNLTDPSVLPSTSDPSSAAVLVYAVGQGASGQVIVRTRSDDGVSFYGDTADQSNHPTHKPPVVLSASLAWEKTDVTGPSALRVDSETWLYYAASGGIGLARSSDGLSFEKAGSPVLAPDASATWETTTPHAPTVAIFPDGSWHMLYAAGASIGEATSADGLHWTRASGNPVLEPSAPVDPKTLGPGEKVPFDEATVEDPLLVPRVDSSGQLQVRVLYAGYAAPEAASSRTGSIGFAARYGATGPLSRQVIPVYVAPGSSASGPAMLEWSGGTMLYVSQLDATLMPSPLALAAAYDPASGPPSFGAYPTTP